jgi:L-arabinokinase
MGYAMLAERAGLPLARTGDGRVAIDDARWGGHLANVSPSEWAAYRDALPETYGGAEFLERYGGTTDTATRVDPARTYAVRRPTGHPIHENHRVRLFRALLAGGAAREQERGLLGELMYQSHASYSACGLGSTGTDRLAALAREAGAARGVYGAKITGGGSGGVVAVLVRNDARDVVNEIARGYERETGRAASVLGGSSPGAMAWGVARLRAR